MDTIEKRRKLVEYIENSNDEIINNLYSIVVSNKKSGEDFLKDYNRGIDEAMERIDRGFFITHEDVEKEAEKW